MFHTTVAKGLFLCKSSRPDIQPEILFLCTIVQNPNLEDWGKLLRMLSYLKATKDDVLTLEDNSTSVIQWHIDTALAAHPDYKSHTGAMMMLVKGSIQSVSTKQKVSTRSSREAELISSDDVVLKVLWTKLFLTAQG